MRWVAATVAQLGNAVKILIGVGLRSYSSSIYVCFSWKLNKSFRNGSNIANYSKFLCCLYDLDGKYLFCLEPRSHILSQIDKREEYCGNYNMQIRTNYNPASNTFSLDELELKPAYFSVCTSLEICFLISSRDPTLATLSFCGLVPEVTVLNFYRTHVHMGPIIGSICLYVSTRRFDLVKALFDMWMIKVGSNNNKLAQIRRSAQISRYVLVSRKL